MKKQRGIGLIEVLIALGLLVVITAMLGQAGQSLIQAQNERNISTSLLQIQAAQATYNSTYSNGYATMADLASCPGSGVAPTKNNACLISQGLTGSNPIYNYEITTLTPTDAPACSVSPCGFLVVATPKNASFGRFVYCVDTDGQLHGEVATTLTLTTNAACSALPVKAVGTTIPAAVPNLFSTSASGLNVANSGQLLMTLPNLPAGTYMITARVTAQWPSLPTTTNIGIRCDLLNSGNELSPSNIVESEGSASASDPNYTTITISGPITLTAGQTAEISGFNWGTATPSQMSGWNGVMTALPVQNAGN
jgi:Tfp pilus assembly protein PilV